MKIHNLGEKLYLYLVICFFTLFDKAVRIKTVF
jgi:hypothetical protein